jgi:hypothetical protein
MLLEGCAQINMSARDMKLHKFLFRLGSWKAVRMNCDLMVGLTLSI